MTADDGARAGAAVAGRPTATRDAATPTHATAGVSGVVDSRVGEVGEVGEVAMWRRRRETVATQGALLRQRAATQRALGATLRTEGHDVRTTARRVLAEALRSRQVAGISGAADAVRGVPAAAVARVSATRNPGRVHLVASAPRPTAAIRVLVVDDTEAVRRVLMRQLARAGHVVVGEAATVAAGVGAAATLTPDVVLLDLHLPDGLGTDAAARISARDGQAGDGRRSPAIILCTGDVAGAWAAGAARCGVAAVLGKPVLLASLDAAVRTATCARGGCPGVRWPRCRPGVPSWTDGRRGAWPDRDLEPLS